jgi:hypothetical protein
MVMGAGALAQPLRRVAAVAAKKRLAVRADFILEHITRGLNEKNAG